MSAGEIAVSLIQFVVVVGITFILLCLLTSYLRFQRMTEKVGAEGSEDVDGATAFQVLIARRLGRAHRDPDPFGILLVDMASGALDSEESISAARSLVHQGIRSRDSLLRLDDHTLGLVVGGGREEGLEVASRILQAVTDPGASGPSIRIGVASYPENGERGEDLLAAAREALAVEEGPAIRPAGDVRAVEPRLLPTPDDPLVAIPSGQRRLLDPMTGFLLSTHLGGVLHKRIAKLRKDRLPGAVLIVQVDHLKRYVDHYGPEGVETIFRHLGCYLQGAVREDDLLARYQEDQVVIIMTARAQDALTAALRITEGIRELPIEHAGAQLKVTASVGIAGYPEHGASSRKLLDHAAAALEATKTRGRNLCLVYDSGMQLIRQTDRDATSF